MSEPCKVIPFRPEVLRRQVVESVRRQEHRPHIDDQETYERPPMITPAMVIVVAIGLLLLAWAMLATARL